MDVVEGERGGQEQQAASEQLIPSKPAQVADSEVHVASASAMPASILRKPVVEDTWQNTFRGVWDTLSALSARLMPSDVIRRERAKEKDEAALVDRLIAEIKANRTATRPSPAWPSPHYSRGSAKSARAYPTGTATGTGATSARTGRTLLRSAFGSQTQRHRDGSRPPFFYYDEENDELYPSNHYPIKQALPVFPETNELDRDGRPKLSAPPSNRDGGSNTGGGGGSRSWLDSLFPRQSSNSYPLAQVYLAEDPSNSWWLPSRPSLHRAHLTGGGDAPLGLTYSGNHGCGTGTGSALTYSGGAGTSKPYGSSGTDAHSGGQTAASGPSPIAGSSSMSSRAVTWQLVPTEISSPYEDMPAIYQQSQQRTTAKPIDSFGYALPAPGASQALAQSPKAKPNNVPSSFAAEREAQRVARKAKQEAEEAARRREDGLISMSAELLEACMHEVFAEEVEYMLAEEYVLTLESIQACVPMRASYPMP